jgi:glucose/arabinose dehydrogenase
VSGIHNGGRLLFGPDGMLYAGTGDASTSGRASDRASLGGKVLRMTPEGRPPTDKPVPGSLVFSTGHRNVQGLAFDPQDRLYATEFGQDAFDEVNLLQPGSDYGWPRVEGDMPATGATRPLLTWTPAEASPSGAVVAGRSLWVAALRGERLWQVPLTGDGGVGPAAPLLVRAFGRLRHVALEPSGNALWLLTSNHDGRGRPAQDDDRVVRVPLGRRDRPAPSGRGRARPARRMPDAPGPTTAREPVRPTPSAAARRPGRRHPRRLRSRRKAPCLRLPQ